MKTLKFFALIALFAMLFSPTLTLAAQLKGASDSVGDSRPSTTTYHEFIFTTNTGGEVLQGMTFSFCEKSSGGCTTPDGLTVDAATFAASTNLDANWVLGTHAGGVLTITNATGQTLTADTPVVVRFAGVTNSAISANCDGDGNTSSDTCFVQMATCLNTNCSTTVDTGITTYTVVNTITVSARVDPTFTFVVATVGSATTNNGIATTVATTPSTIPFGNLAVGTPAYAAHDLQVITNTNAGYTVSMRMATPTQGQGVMEGVYTQNNIDSFTGTWGSPVVWSEPNGGTPNINTGWLGANTTDTDVAGWSVAPESKFGPVSTANNIVMQEPGSDDGTDHIYVTYAIEVNVQQPADTYTGTLIYSALPTY